jgi:hypothetical protein
LLAHRASRSLNVTDEVLAGVVAPIAAVLEVVVIPISAEAADSIAAAVDTTAARVLLAGGQSPHGK